MCFIKFDKIKLKYYTLVTFEREKNYVKQSISYDNLYYKK